MKDIRLTFPLITIFFSVMLGCSPKASEAVNMTGGSGQIIAQNNEETGEKDVRQIADLTEKDIQNLLKFWRNAQVAGDFEGYRNCYTKPFKGVKTTPKGSQDYDYAEWMNDRRKMLAKAVGLDVEVKNLQISIDGETAVAEFDQFYRSKNYSDRGPKILKIKQTPDGAKIVYELMKASYPL